MVSDESSSSLDDECASFVDVLCEVEEKTKRTKQEEEITLEDEEAKQAVKRLKILVLLVISLSALCITLAGFFLARRQEIANFTECFKDDSLKVLDAIGSRVESTVKSLDAFSTTIIVHARATDQKWPFVTVPYFSKLGSKFLSVTFGVQIWITMFIENKFRLAWEEYSTLHDWWINETINENINSNIFNGIQDLKTIHTELGPIPYNATRSFYPTWQSYPISEGNGNAFNQDLFSRYFHINNKVILKEDTTMISPPVFSKNAEQIEEPMSEIIYPVFDTLDNVMTTQNVSSNSSKNHFVGYAGTRFYWRDVIKNILLHDAYGLVAVFESVCSESFTYKIRGRNAVFLGKGVHRDSGFRGMEAKRFFTSFNVSESNQFSYNAFSLDDGTCPLVLSLYPSSDMEDFFLTNQPAILASTMLLIFLFTSSVFLVYVCQVDQQQRMILSTAKQSNAIVSSLFPSNVRNQLFEKTVQPETKRKSMRIDMFLWKEDSTTMKVDSNEINYGSNDFSSKPIADLYPDTTVLFADIAGFTSWSSVRDPCQVFTLLESLYREFDKAAKSRRVFKVETIGDSYVAVSGLPQPMKNHAVVMVRFGDDILLKMSEVTCSLAKTLGPDTIELSARVGINSGPTTAGVLRGEKSRFQLFGDTVNTAARMESNGLPGRIQCSQKTADLLIQAGRGKWLTPRDELINAKGKGKMQTYWVQPSVMNHVVYMDGEQKESKLIHQKSEIINFDFISDKMTRLIDWNVDLFLECVKEIHDSQINVTSTYQATKKQGIDRAMPIDYVTDILDATATNPKSGSSRGILKTDVSLEAEEQLREYLTKIGGLYNDNPFHNFEHACHVAMSTKKLLDRVILTKEREKVDINIDPLTKFAIIFGAIIHDVDHQGVPNGQLIQEENEVAKKYQNKSVAEQNSFDVAWDLFMSRKYRDLRQYLFKSDDDMKRFRQVVATVVLATDIFDPTLRESRQGRWERVFEDIPERCPEKLVSTEMTSWKTIIVIEHLIQASDVVHTMQHWNVYQKWNHRLFQEAREAYNSGRSSANPADGWYEGELRFFDNYVIPLAKKLKTCGAFGANCDAFLDYAHDNRHEWESKGQQIVEGWTQVKREPSIILTGCDSIRSIDFHNGTVDKVKS